MIISHAHRYIFFAVPKTATHSVREVLRASKDQDDWEQQVLFGEQSIPIPEIAQIKHGHVSARQIQAALNQHQWQTYYKFGFVRNPFDRFVSICAFLNRENPNFNDNSLAWMKMATRRPAFRQRILVRPQFEQLTNENNEIAMNFLGRYECLQSSLDTILDKLKLEPIQLKVRNQSEHAAYQSYYDDELRDWVSEFYKEDLERFGYEF